MIELRRLRHVLLLVSALTATMACGRSHPRFADRPVVWEVGDDKPCAVPHVRPFLPALYYSNIYVRREAVELLDPRRPPEAADINAYDEVPRSSWFEPERVGLDGYRVVGPPQPPLHAVDQPASSRLEDARVVVDARGVFYELLGDVPRRPEMRTAASAIASRLVYALGYRTPEVWITTEERGQRVAAMRWPVGIDVGATFGGLTTPDDPNDVLPHPDRRTLRALGTVTAWIAMSELRPGTLRDVYVGSPGQGHVQHWIVGLDGALGVAALQNLEESSDPDEPGGSPLYSLYTLGLSPKPDPAPPTTRWPAVGHMSADVEASSYAPRPPFEPLDRVRAEDRYWIAKRIAGVNEEMVHAAVGAGQIGDPEARAWIEETLRARQHHVVANGFGATTPCDFVEVDDGALSLVDRAIEHGFARPEATVYQVELLDVEGDTLVEPSSVRADGRGRLTVPLPRLSEGTYLIVSVTAFRGGRSAPRPAQFHIVMGDGPPRVIGVRH